MKSESEVAQLRPTLWEPMDSSLPELPFPSPGDRPDPGIKPGSPALLANALPFEPPGKPSIMTVHQRLTIKDPKLGVSHFLKTCNPPLK